MIFAHMAGQIQLDQFSNPRCSSQWRGLFGGFAAAALVLLPANNMVKLWRIFLFFFFFFFPSLFFLFYPEGGLRPGVAELWSRSTPTGMRIVSDLRAAPLASSLPFKAANCRGHKARATADCLLQEAGIFFTDELEPTERLNQVLLFYSTI